MIKVPAIAIAVALSVAGLMAPQAAATVPISAPRPSDGVIDRDLRVDPRDAGLDSGYLPWADLRESSRTLFRAEGIRFLRVVLWSRRSFPVPKRYFSMTDGVWYHTYLDTRGDGGWDYRIFSIASTRGQSCEALQRGHPKVNVGDVHASITDSGGLACRVRASALHITKPVRWRVASRIPVAPPQDLAPDHGWYP
jgi:hypothetical protein